MWETPWGGDQAEMPYLGQVVANLACRTEHTGNWFSSARLITVPYASCPAVAAGGPSHFHERSLQNPEPRTHLRQHSVAIEGEGSKIANLDHVGVVSKFFQHRL